MNTKNTSKGEKEALQEALNEAVQEMTTISKTTIDNLQNASENIVKTAQEEIAKASKGGKAPGGVFIEWLSHTLHYPGDEAAQKILDDFEAARVKEEKRRAEIAKKLGRTK